MNRVGLRGICKMKKILIKLSKQLSVVIILVWNFNWKAKLQNSI